jgi:hypothetical protein
MPDHHPTRVLWQNFMNFEGFKKVSSQNGDFPFLCHLHFDPVYINESSKRRVLAKFAYPTIGCAGKVNKN